MKIIKLNNNVEMPIIGLGVARITGSQCIDTVKLAIDKYSYKMIDTAQLYQNEAEVGIAIKECKTSRKNIFITTKVWVNNYGYNNTLNSIMESLKKLQVEYIDLVLIHEPYGGDYFSSWQALETLYKKGLIRAIGISNFHGKVLSKFYENVEIKPMVNQIELHPILQRVNEIALNNKYQIAIQSWASLGNADSQILKNPVLISLANKYNKSVAQIVLRWVIQQNIITIPKTVTESRLKENIEIFDFEISGEDMDKIRSLNKEKSLADF